jgi:ferredoxin-NADP reductase/Na+-translocating ferredoxin:NAD+ oxidoreductase RnfD subunit
MLHKILKPVDYVLNRITMYRFVLYYLIGLLFISVVYGYFGILSYKPLAILFSTAYILTVCYITNFVFSKSFDAPVNGESVYITALILAFIISPISSLTDSSFYSLATWASILAMSSKYIFAIGKKHIFNPAAIAVTITAFALNESASWWVGTTPLLPFVLVGGLLMVRKISRADLVWSFLIFGIISILFPVVMRGGSILPSLIQAMQSSPLFFFAFVMLTEPLTTPPTKKLRISYGAFVGILFSPSFNIAGIYSTPEISLILGNIYSYIISPKEKLLLKLRGIVGVAKNTFDFVFQSDKRFDFKPGQYMEWTLDQKNTDSRGNRRYFTIASSPTESDVRLGVKFYPNASSFKKTLAGMEDGDTMIASQVAGDFVMPKDKNRKLAFIAGGIGVTPFRSMIKYLIDRNERRQVVILYSNNTVEDIAYSELFFEAERKLGIETFYTLSDKTKIPADWAGGIGFIDEHMIRREVPDFMDRFFYVSGPQVFVSAFDQTLKNMGVKNSNIKKDFFPGFA